MKYVAFGTDCFCRFKFQPVRNSEGYSTFPAETILQDGTKLPGGLIGYPIGVKNGVTSDEAWDETFEMMSDRRGEQMFSFRLKETIHFNLNNLTINEFIQRWTYNGNVSIDFSILAQKFPSVLIRQQFIKDMPTLFKGWEIHDTILVMDPSIVIAKKG